MAIASYYTFLMMGTTEDDTTTWAKLVDIKDYPDLYGTPELLQTTTLSDYPSHTYIPGLQSADNMTFTCNYTSADFDTLKALEGDELDLAVWFGATESGGVVTPDGSNGKFTFKGQITVSITGKGVNEVAEMVVNVVRSSQITKS